MPLLQSIYLASAYMHITLVFFIFCNIEKFNCKHISDDKQLHIEFLNNLYTRLCDIHVWRVSCTTCGASVICIVYNAYVDRSWGYLLLVVVHYGSYQRVVRYLYSVADCFPLVSADMPRVWNASVLKWGCWRLGDGAEGFSNQHFYRVKQLLYH